MRPRAAKHLVRGPLRSAGAAGVGAADRGRAAGHRLCQPMRADASRPGRPARPKTLPARPVEARVRKLTFAAELRAERSDRSSEIVDADSERYERFGKSGADRGMEDRRKRSAAGGSACSARESCCRLPVWPRRARPFAGGADYIAWKINRHAGTKIELKAWQRRWPLLAAITLLPRLLKSGRFASLRTAPLATAEARAPTVNGLRSSS
jgi:hypothetical protein